MQPSKFFLGLFEVRSQRVKEDIITVLLVDGLFFLHGDMLMRELGIDIARMFQSLLRISQSVQEQDSVLSS